MPSIENRIVQMQFDNTSFERRLSTTMQSLDKLNQTIANAGSRNGLATLGESVRGFNLDPISTSIDGVSGKFLAMSTIAVTALSIIVSKAIDVGARVVSALSLDPVISGFQEYQTQIGAIQTILANTDSKGTTLDQVNAALDQLNEYSDKTIYNFTEMTRNIGTFTAAGVDLDTSVQSIKGIANLAAISGSNSQQASTAMYQLSQAIATGSVKLMDWNSVVNAGMGGEVFQKALFETGKMMGTIAGTDMTTTFEQWTDAGNSFRGSLETGWLTAEVLTNTLKGFTGELTRDQILALGYTEQQADEIQRLGQLGVESATKVRTLKALLDTTKEALSSGWSQSFRLIFGDFEQATELFTGVSNALSGVIQRSADSRNALLQGWSDLGGRTTLIEGLKTAFQALGEILAPIREAFSTIFPPLTAERLMAITVGFKELVDRIRPSEQTVENLRRIFTGFFGALEIGWTVIKETAKFVGQLLGSFSGAGSGAFLEFAAKIGDFFSGLNTKLITEGGIAKFFDELPAKIQPVIDKIVEFKDKALEFFEQFKIKAEPIVGFLEDITSSVGDFFGALGGNTMDVASAATDRLGQRFDTLRGIADKIGDIWGPFKEALNKIVGVLEEIWTHVSTWFGELGTKLAAVIGPGDFDAVVDAVNVGLLGGIAAILLKFFKDGFKFDLGDGLFSSIGQSFEELTGVLSAMQTQIKADALLKIATAVGVLTASVLVLSMIDSAALTKALTAMAVGFGQLLGAFALLTKLAIGPATAAKIAIISGALIALAGAMLILSIAVKILSTMGWEELGKGLAGIAGLLLMVTAVAGPLGNASGGMIRAGIAMGIMGASLLILAAAVKIFSMFSWADMAKGFIAVGVGLGLIAAAMHLMPTNMVITGAGLVLVAAGLNLLALAVMQFANFSWSDMAKGAAGIGGGLLIIAGAMALMPPTMPLIGGGLILVAAAMIILARAMQSFGSMSWGEIAKGLLAMGGALLVLAVGAMAMSGAMAGAAAITLMAVGLTILVKVIKELAKIKVGDMIKAMIGLAAVFAILGGAALLLSPITPALLGLGAALILVGAGFALFGAGAALIAIAFEKIAAAGDEGLSTLISIIDIVIDKLPELVGAFALGLIELATTILDAAPVLLDSLTVLLEHVIDSLIELVPKVGELLTTLVMEVIRILREHIPQFIQLGLDLIVSLLTGIRDHIQDVVTLALEIITNFINGIAQNIGMVIEAAVNLITSFVNGIAAELPRIIESGVNLLVSFLQGIADNLTKVTEAVGEVITAFIDGVVGLYGDIISAGTDALVEFLSGITDNLIKVVNAVGDMIAEFITAVSDNALDIAQAGLDTLVEFLGGITDNLVTVTMAVTMMIIEFIRTIGASANAIATAGAQTLVAFLKGIAANMLYITRAAFEILIAFINGLADAINKYAPELRSAGRRLAGAIIDGATFGLASRAGEVGNKIRDVFGGAVNIGRGILGIGGPSTVFCDIGRDMMAGAAAGISNNNAPIKAIETQAEIMADTMKKSLRNMALNLESMEDFNPSITPVLDLTNVERDVQGISALMPNTVMASTLSYSQAQGIASSTRNQETDSSLDSSEKTGEIKFEQNIYAPEQLSAGEIYRQTRSQLVMAKEELRIP